MKNLIILGILMASTAMADCETTLGHSEATATKIITTDVPSHLKGATIIVRRADGKETAVPAELFKVVPRKRQEIVLEKTQTVNTTCTNDAERLKNRVSLLAGRGTQEGIDVEKSATTVSAQSKVGAVGGIMYQRSLSRRISIGGQVQTNNSVLGTVGLDF